jgi:Uma2 family endonuclease
MNLGGVLWQQLRGKPCKAYESNMRVALLKTGLRTYPDVSVYSRPMEFDLEDPDRTTATNPAVLLEVLSPSTEAYDRGTKADHYRQIESLVAHALVSQDRPMIELFLRDGTAWNKVVAAGLDASIHIPGPNVTIALADVYDGVAFD